ncbi:MAG: diguanylate cyclase [Peptostreptococcaceae bacterium]|nr:diguanylate cyclase [Peptostreptococcaceae bacterium]
MDIANLMIVIITISAIVSFKIFRSISVGKGRVNLDGSLIFLFGEMLWDILYFCQLSATSLKFKMIFYNGTLIAAAISIIGFYIFMQSLSKASLKEAQIGYALLVWPILVAGLIIYYIFHGNYEIFIENPALRGFQMHTYLVFSRYALPGHLVFSGNYFFVLLCAVTTYMRLRRSELKQKGNIMMLVLLFLLMRSLSLFMVFNPINFSIFNSMIFSVFSMLPIKLFIYSYISNADVFNLMMVNRYSLVEKIKDSVVVVDEKGMILDFNEAAAELMQIFNIRHMDRVYNFYEELKKTLTDFDLENNRNRTVEYAFETMDHQKRALEVEALDVNFRKSGFRMGKGRGVYKKDCVFFIKDITQSYKQELDFMKYKAAFDSSKSGILIVDKNGIIEEVNPGFTELTGFQPEDVVGKNPKILQSGYHSQEFYDELWGTILSGDSWTGRLYNVKKDGSKYWEKCTISPIFSRDGTITHFMGIKDDITTEKEAEDSLKAKSDTDYLTGIANRRSLMEKSTAAFIRAREEKRNLSILMMDIDHFKSVNDSYGHGSGDQVLKAFAELIKDTVRESDILGRYGGEEFMVALPNTGGKDALTIAERIRKNMKKKNFDFEEESVHISVSIGVASINEDTRTLAELIERADKALYEAKSQGRNQVLVR